MLFQLSLTLYRWLEELLNIFLQGIKDVLRAHKVFAEMSNKE